MSDTGSKESIQKVTQAAIRARAEIIQTMAKAAEALTQALTKINDQKPRWAIRISDTTVLMTDAEGEPLTRELAYQHMSTLDRRFKAEVGLVLWLDDPGEELDV